MTAIAMPSIATPALRASAVREAAVVTLRLEGTADLRVKESLDAILAAVHAAALGATTANVDVDLRQLEFMNSSCFKAFVTWIGRIQELDTKQRYHVRFLSDPAMLWQRRSLHALACFATDLIQIVTP